MLWVHRTLLMTAAEIATAAAVSRHNHMILLVPMNFVKRGFPITWTSVVQDQHFNHNISYTFLPVTFPEFQIHVFKIFSLIIFWNWNGNCKKTNNPIPRACTLYAPENLKAQDIELFLKLIKCGFDQRLYVKLFRNPLYTLPWIMWKKGII